MNTLVFENIGGKVVRTKSEPLLLNQAGLVAGALALVDSYTIEATGQTLDMYETSVLPAGTWLQIDDLEMSVDENLSQDEVAQCIFAICGGDLHREDAVGETSRHWVYYSTELKGLLGLSPKPTKGS